MTAAPKRQDPISEEDSVHIPNETIAPTKKPSRKKWFIIGGIVILVVLVLSLTLGLYYGLKKKVSSFLLCISSYHMHMSVILGRVFYLQRD